MATTITIQFSRQEDIGSKLIRWFTHGDYSHVDVLEASGNLYGARSDVCAGAPGGVQSRPSNYSTFSAVKRVTLDVTIDQYTAFWKFAYAQRGKPYDSMAILGFITGRNWREDDAWFCAEIIAAALEAAKYFPFPLADRNAKISPDDLLLILSAFVDVSA